MNQAQEADCKPFDQDHPGWTQFLKKWVKGNSLNYGGAKKSGAVLLKSYLADLEAVCKNDLKKWNKNQRLAFWINVYNAYTVKLILDNYPLKSIRKIGLLPGAAWREKAVSLKRLEGKNISLSYVENDIIRKRFKEPRIHFALVCASKGCPPIRSRAYTATKLNRQLEAQTKAFLNVKTHNRYHGSNGTLYLSRIFDWYKKDFGKDQDKLLAFIGKYIPELRSDLEKGRNVGVEYLAYDWALNGY
jgi:hypothetical protein